MDLNDFKASDSDLLDVAIESNEFEDEDMEDVSTTDGAAIVSSSCAVQDRIDRPSEAPKSRLQSEGRQDHERNNFCLKEKPTQYNDREGFDKRRLFKTLHVPKDSSPDFLGRELAYRLHEVKKELFVHVVRVLGVEKAIDVFEETKSVLRSGGLLTDDAKRRRTPGGTFLYLMKARGFADEKQVKEIFREESARHKQMKKRKAKVNRERHTLEMAAKIGKQNKEVSVGDHVACTEKPCAQLDRLPEPVDRGSCGSRTTGLVTHRCEEGEMPN